MSEADAIHWVNMSVEADEVLASFNWYSASTDKEESTVVVNMAEEIAKLRAAIGRVRALHASVEIGFGPICDECSSASDGWIVPYPCPTLRAIDGEGA